MSGTDETAVRDLLEARAQATRDKDAETAVGFYAPEIVNFDLAPPLAQRGREATDPKNLREWFDSWDGPLGIETRDMTIRVDGALAIAFGFVHLTGKRTDGDTTDVWARSTVALEKRGGEWKIVHEHGSFPMKMDGSEKAANDLKPEPANA